MKKIKHEGGKMSSHTSLELLVREASWRSGLSDAKKPARHKSGQEHSKPGKQQFPRPKGENLGVLEKHKEDQWGRWVMHVEDCGVS